MDLVITQDGVLDEERRRKKVELLQEAIHGHLEKRRQQGEVNKELMVQQEEDDLLSTLLSKLKEIEKDVDLEKEKSSSFEPNCRTEDGESSKEAELGEIAKGLDKIKRQNFITHCLLGAVIIMTAVWQFNEVSFLLEVRKMLSNPFKSLGELVKGSIKGRGRKPVIEASPLPPVGIPDVTRTDLSSVIISNEED